MATNVDWTDEAVDGIDDVSGDRMAFAAWVDETPDPAAAQEEPMNGINELGESFGYDLGDTVVKGEAVQSLDALEDVFVDALNSKDASEYFGHVLRGLRRAPGVASRPGTSTADPLPRFMALVQRYRAQGIDEMEALEDLADQFAEDGSDEAASIVGGLLARALARPPARRPSRPLNRPLRQQLVRNTRQAAQTLVRRQGPQAMCALPAVARSIRRTAARRRLPARILPSAVRNVAARVARAPALVRQIARSGSLLRPRSPAFLQPGQTFVRTIYGWGQYKRRVEELPPDQQAVLKGFGDAIIASYKPGGQPVRTVKVYGHADLDTPPNPQREQQYSEERAQTVRDWLMRYVGSTITAQIVWDARGFGAKQLKERTRETEAKRRQNRRVEISLISGAITLPSCPSAPTTSPQFTAWLQRVLNRLLGIQLHVNGVFDTYTWNALRNFQASRGLPATGAFSYGTLRAMRFAGAEDPPCKVPVPVQICQTTFSDARTKVKQNNWSLPDNPFNTIAFSSIPVLATNGSGFDRFAAQVALSVRPYGGQGQVFYAETTKSTIPQLWVTFIPNALDFGSSVPIHVFFAPPPTEGMVRSPYPYGPEWNSFVDRYLIGKHKSCFNRIRRPERRTFSYFLLQGQEVFMEYLAMQLNYEEISWNSCACWVPSFLKRQTHPI